MFLTVCYAVLLCRYAATRGDTVKLRAMLQQGFNPDSSDYGEAAWQCAYGVVLPCQHMHGRCCAHVVLVLVGLDAAAGITP